MASANLYQSAQCRYCALTYIGVTLSYAKFTVVKIILQKGNQQELEIGLNKMIVLFLFPV